MFNSDQHVLVLITSIYRGNFDLEIEFVASYQNTKIIWNLERVENIPEYILVLVVLSYGHTRALSPFFSLI